MKNVGIIAEYNPFHYGHEYQLNIVKKEFPEKKIIICLSGDFVERGEPAVFNKALRAECAIAGGADAVIELPFLYSCSSSEYFATSAVLSLFHTGIVDTLCFGAECDDLDTLTFLANFFINESPLYKEKLKEGLSSGLSFPKARAYAVDLCMPQKKYSEILNKPNNILAIDYIKTIIKYNLPIKPYIIKRSHDNHTSTDISGTICSSTALRNSIEREHFNSGERDYSIWKDHIPKAVFDVIVKSPYALPLFFKDFYPSIQYKLFFEDNNLKDHMEMTDALYNTISNLKILPSSFDELNDTIRGRHITEARIRRCLLNILLSRTKALIRQYPADKTQYIRILAIKEGSSTVIRDMNTWCSLPIINKTSIAAKNLPASAKQLFAKEISENMLYRQIFYNKYGMILPTEYEQSVIIG